MLLLERIDTLVGNVTNIGLQTDINRVHETALDVKRVWKAMTDCREMGLLLNERQKLFGMKVVPFEHLHKLMKEFEPYRSLWVTASGKHKNIRVQTLRISGSSVYNKIFSLQFIDWLRWHEVWMDNPLINVDGSQIDSLVMDMYRTITRAVRTFQEFPSTLLFMNRAKKAE